jgi:hypothetical protein
MRYLLGVVLIIVVTFVTPIGALTLMLGRVLQENWTSAATRSAEALLRTFLTEAEYRQIRSQGYLEVASPTNSERVYRVPRRPGRVLVLDGGKPSELLCLQPAVGDLPEADLVLMHKLLIQADEDMYLQTANHFSDLARWVRGSRGIVSDGCCQVWP